VREGGKEGAREGTREGGREGYGSTFHHVDIDAPGVDAQNGAVFI
jgi:hypothetical protein